MVQAEIKLTAAVVSVLVIAVILSNLPKRRRRNKTDEQFYFLSQQNAIIMTQVEQLKQASTELRAEVTNLQGALDKEQDQVSRLLQINRDTETRLNETIASLQKQLADATDPEALQSVIDDLNATKDALRNTKADLETTVDVAEEPPVEEPPVEGEQPPTDEPVVEEPPVEETNLSRRRRS
jgi:seryl-tRNA synthetase